MPGAVAAAEALQFARELSEGAAAGGGLHSSRQAGMQAGLWCQTTAESTNLPKAKPGIRSRAADKSFRHQSYRDNLRVQGHCLYCPAVGQQAVQIGPSWQVALLWENGLTSDFTKKPIIKTYLIPAAEPRRERV